MSPRNLEDWLSLQEVRHPKAIDLGLDRCQAVWERLGAPAPARQSFVVAGTNGKGSTVATICALLGELGYSYGSYTSPHITHYNERISIGGVAVGDAALVEAFDRIEAARGKTSLSYFEFGTLAAFLLLADAALDFAVLEVGLGGRLDAVNLIDAHCAVITPIGLDHQDYLGDDLDAIGFEKAGIMRPGRPVICGEPEPPASVIAHAARTGAPLKRLGRDFGVETTGQGMRFRINGAELSLPVPSLRGLHQVNNAATALAAVLELLPAAAGRHEALAQGLSGVKLEGRFERVSNDPAVWIDVGHNPMAAQAISRLIAEAIGAGRIQHCRCVLAMLADKDAAAVGAEMCAVISEWYCAGLSGDRGQSGEELGRRLSPVCGNSPVHVFQAVDEALEAAMAASAPDEAVLVFGSFFTAAAAATWFDAHGKGHAPADTARIRARGQGTKTE